MEASENSQLPLFTFSEDNVGRTEPEKSAVQESPESQFSNYVVYVDESGDHSLKSIDQNYPIFVLAFCVFNKRHYSEAIVSALEKFKFNHFGHDQVVLHENEIRKETGAFNIFKSRDEKHDFLHGLTEIIDRSNFILISCTIDKRTTRSQGDTESNPYHTALGFCMETLYELMKEKKQHGKRTHVIVECRGE